MPAPWRGGRANASAGVARGGPALRPRGRMTPRHPPSFRAGRRWPRRAARRVAPMEGAVVELARLGKNLVGRERMVRVVLAYLDGGELPVVDAPGDFLLRHQMQQFVHRRGQRQLE